MLQERFEEVVKSYFPHALSAKDSTITYLGKLQNDYHIDISRVLLATSVCSDEINAVSTNFFSVVFGPFQLGGLGGFPHAGDTGMMAFAKHIPDDGAALILYGPHIGITIDGEIGKIYRPRQHARDNSCGSLVAAVSKFTEDPEYSPKKNDLDFQQYIVESSLAKRKDEFLKDPIPIRKATEITYENINDRIHAHIKKTKDAFPVRKVILLGGIIINTNFGYDDYFDPRNFEVIDLKK